MAPPSDLVARAKARVGTTLLGKYRLDAVVGIGGMAIVYAATHRNSKRVAVKILHPDLAQNSNIRTYFQREGYAANSVLHRGAVRVDDDDVTPDGTVFIVMELLEGIGVEELRLRHWGRLPVGHAASIGEQLLDVLAAAHRRDVIHRDIKPSNLFLTADGSLKVLDFGIARVRDETRAGTGPGTGAGGPLGTPGFMAPEQAGGRTADARTDVWAAGATLFRLLSGELTHAGSTPQELCISAARDEPRPLSTVLPSIPPPIAAVVDRALAMDRDARWPSAEAMREALLEAHRAVHGGPPPRATEQAWERPSNAEGPLEPTSILPDSVGGSAWGPKELPARPAAVRRRASWRWGPVAIAALLVVGAALGLGRQIVPWAAPDTVMSGAVEPPLREAEVDLFQPAPVVFRVPSEEATPEASDAAVHPPPLQRDIPAAKPASEIDCNPPTYVDRDGIKRPKPQCL